MRKISNVGFFFLFFVCFSFYLGCKEKKRKEKKVRGKLEGKVLFQWRKWVSSVGRIASGTERKLLWENVLKWEKPNGLDWVRWEVQSLCFGKKLNHMLSVPEILIKKNHNFFTSTFRYWAKRFCMNSDTFMHKYVKVWNKAFY